MTALSKSRELTGELTGGAGHLLLYATEIPRTALDVGALVAMSPLLRDAKRGDGHPVLVLPGLAAGDGSTVILRRWIARQGYPVAGWELGRNKGPTAAVIDGLPKLVSRMAATYGEPVSVVGWSMGGIFARRLACRMPDQIRQVITFGSPLKIHHQQIGYFTAGERAYRRYSRHHVEDRIFADSEAAAGVLPVPSTSVYSRWDGIVDWRACLQPVGPTSENIEVRASHLGLGFHPATFWIVADRLARPVDAWRPFRAPSGWAPELAFGAIG